MTQQWSALLAAAVVAAVTVSLAAQGRSPSPVGVPPADSNARPGTQKTTPAPAAQGRTPNTTIITGCLERAPVATASVTVRRSAAPGYVLTNPRMTAEGDTPPAAAGAAPCRGARALSSRG